MRHGPQKGFCLEGGPATQIQNQPCAHGHLQRSSIQCYEASYSGINHQQKDFLILIFARQASRGPNPPVYPNCSPSVTLPHRSPICLGSLPRSPAFLALPRCRRVRGRTEQHGRHGARLKLPGRPASAGSRRRSGCHGLAW